MTRWQRFKHAFVTCRGPEVGREYIEPHRTPGMKGDQSAVQQMVDEGRLGVTLIHYRCSTCGRRFTNRELGDWRDESVPSA